MVEITQRFFCCPLRQGIPFAGYYTSVLSTLACASSALQFFGGSGVFKLIGVLSFCYYLIYLVMSRNLIQGIRSEQRDKFVGWIVMSVLTVLFSVCGFIYNIVLLCRWNILKASAEFAGIMIAVMTLWALIILVLVYCIWGVVTLWGIYGEAQANGLAVAIVTSESSLSKLPVVI